MANRNRYGRKLAHPDGTFSVRLRNRRILLDPRGPVVMLQMKMCNRTDRTSPVFVMTRLEPSGVRVTELPLSREALDAIAELWLAIRDHVPREIGKEGGRAPGGD